MSDLEPNAQEDKDVESVSDSPGRTQEPLQSHTFSLKNNAAGLSSDEHENPLNGTQPNPFVYSSVPAVPHAGNSLPSGALVNGPGSHPTSEVHCVLNKGTVLSNSVLDAAWQAEKDTSPEVLPPPSELQSDAWKNTAGPIVKTLATQPGVNTPLSHSEENESKLACSTQSGDSADQMHISQPLTKQTIKTRSLRDAEWPGSSVDGYDNAEVIRWDSARECFLHDGRRLETNVTHQRDSKHNTYTESLSGCLEKVNNRYAHFCSGNDAENVDTGSKDQSPGGQFDIKHSVMPSKDLSRNIALDSERRIYSTAQEAYNEENDPEDENSASAKVEQPKIEQLEQDPLFFSCTICNVNFKKKRHFHRHMMYHLGKHNQVKSETVSQPFICRECGRLFCDSNSLMRHIIIHRDRLQKLMEEIKGLKTTEFEDGATTGQCPQCIFDCSCPKISVQHAKTHDNLKHYYFCEECNYITLTQQALEAHMDVTHLNTHQPKYRRMTHTNDAEGPNCVLFQMGSFTSRDKAVLERNPELERQQSCCGDYKKLTDRPKKAAFKPNPFKSTFEERKGDMYVQKPNDKAKRSPSINSLSPSLWRIDNHGKLLLQQLENFDAATDLTCVEDEEDEEEENNGRQAFGSSKQAICPATADSFLSARKLKLDQMFCQGSENDPASGILQAQTKQNSPSMRKMSTPLHNTIESMNGNVLPRLSQRLKKQCAVRELSKSSEVDDNFSDVTSEATGSFLESNENESIPYAQGYLRKRQSFSAKHQSPHKLSDDGDEDCSDIEQLIIKEEYIETTACDDSPELPVTSPVDRFDIFPTPAVEHRPCPYCPALFESGVGLSNHVRGHLHRVGLSYDARHMVTPEQVTLRDRRLRVRRRTPTGMRKTRKAVKPQTQGEHTCPLCCGWFDTKTGLSNHVRGHLKRIGRSVSSSSKSPLCILNELLQDKKEHRDILQVLNESQFPSHTSASQKFISRDDLFFMRAGIPVKTEYGVRSPILDGFVPKREAEVFLERTKLQVEAQRGPKEPSSTLVELLKTKQESVELGEKQKQETYATSVICNITKDYMEETWATSVEPNWEQGECHSKRICIQCTDPFPSAAMLPGHLRAFAHRKRIAILEERGYDSKQKKPRPRPGLKRKLLPSMNTEIYTLTCRFCDLVFQGPLSVQEDWIKHLQRHLLHTSVPHSGTGMVEVLGFITK
ncbi:zinc finger protein 644 [Mugil cephalus]|uniref:zinc finger protein 644 n=1 Tax=Mugil cephalus TaxID=48193 RepID=UPI001FB69EC6|nr:zinc finger protein 644 [Mugil cephalus]XP_047442286.1 zinc finger protein 644 [Mugil cephalus]